MGFSDLGKKNILKRSKIEYSEAEPLTHKIASYPITIDLIEDLFEINSSLLLDINFIKRVEKQLPTDNDLLEKILLKYLIDTEGELPQVTSKRSFSALCKAYISFNQFLIEENKSLYLLQRVRNLFVFGQYKNISSDTALLDAKGIFDDRLKVISQCSKYSAIPYMIDKKQKFSDFASYDNAMRAYNAITSSGGKDDEQICLLYWGLVFLALLNKEVNPLVRDYFLTLSDETHIKTKGIFSRYKEATKESNSVRN